MVGRYFAVISPAVRYIPPLRFGDTAAVRAKSNLSLLFVITPIPKR